VVIGKPVNSAEILVATGNNQWQAGLELRNRTRSWLLDHCGEPDLEYERSPLFSGKRLKADKIRVLLMRTSWWRSVFQGNTGQPSCLVTKSYFSADFPFF